MTQELKEKAKNKLTAEQYRILVEKGTEIPFTGEFLNNEEKGVYTCALCGNELFNSDKKFKSGSGWPSFFDVVSDGNVKLQEDRSHGMIRTEVLCANCGGHLGHVFDYSTFDKEKKSYYCINSCSLNFKKQEEK